MEFLTALSAAFQRAQMYPEGHPTLESALQQVMLRIESLLDDRPAAIFAISPTQLFAGATASDAGNSVLREMAGRLFRRNVGTIKLSRGITQPEISLLVASIALDAASPERHATPHLVIEPLSFDSLTLDALAREHPDEDVGRAAVWQALAETMLGTRGAGTGDTGVTGHELAANFDTLPPDPTRDGVVIMYLHEAAEACRDRTAPGAQMLRRRVSGMLRELRPETIERLLGRSQEGERAHDLLRDLVHLASAPAALEVLLATARMEARKLPAPMVRLLMKLADKTETGPSAARFLASEQFLALVGDLVASWESPGEPMVEPLDHLPPPLVPGLSRSEAYFSDPLRLLTLQLDMGDLGPAAERSVRTLVAQGRVRPLVELMGQLGADDPVTHSYRPLVVGSGALVRLLEAAPVDIEMLERLAPDVGPAAIAPLLDALARSDERSLRRRLLELLAHFGNAVVPEVIARLPGAPWFVQRNLLRLLQMVPDPQVEAIATEFSRHQDSRVRVEGFRLLMRYPGARAKGIVAGLSDPDSSGVRVAVMAAGEDCPVAAAPLLLSGLAEGRIDPGLVPAAIRALGPLVQQPEVLDVLLKYAGRKLPLLGWRVAPRSKESLAALAALARHWGSDPRARPLLLRAQRHPDPEIRSVASA